MTIIEQLVNDFKKENPAATPEQLKQFLQSIESHTKVIKEDEYAFNSEYDDGTAMPERSNVDPVTLDAPAKEQK